MQQDVDFDKVLKVDVHLLKYLPFMENNWWSQDFRGLKSKYWIVDFLQGFR